MGSPGSLTRLGCLIIGAHAVIAMSLLIFAYMSFRSRSGRSMMASLAAFMILAIVLHQITAARIFMIIGAVLSAAVTSALPFFLVQLSDRFPTEDEALRTRLEGRHLGDLRVTARLDLLEKRLRTMSESPGPDPAVSQEYGQMVRDVLSSVDELRNEITSRSGQAGE